LRRPLRLGGRGMVALGLALGLVTCTNDHPTGPGPVGQGFLAIRPVLAAPAEAAAFGLTIDRLRVAAIRPVADTVVDTTVYFDPAAASLSLALPVPLHAPSETFFLLLELRAGSRVLFSGFDTVQVSVGPPDTTGSFFDQARGVAVDGNVGNGKIYTANYSSSTVSRLEF
jgi:hypothetical protein